MNEPAIPGEVWSGYKGKYIFVVEADGRLHCIKGGDYVLPNQYGSICNEAYTRLPYAEAERLVLEARLNGGTLPRTKTPTPAK